MKNILSEHDDIKVKDLLSFINIDKKDIIKLAESDYSMVYDKSFKLVLKEMHKNRLLSLAINEITPEVLFDFMFEVTINGSDILNYLGGTLGLTKLFFCDHPSFADVRNYALDKGSLSKRSFPKKNTNLGMFPLLYDLSLDKIDFLDIEGKKKIRVSETKEENVVDFNDEKIWLILDDVLEKFVGQETAAEHLFYNIVNNQQLALRDDVSDGERSIIFLDGPTGTGKTAITREITDKLGIPFTASSVTNYSSTGYVGGNITDTLKELYKKAKGNLELAQRGIIVFDEFDKITYSRSGGLEMKKAVQQQLLDFMGGGKYKISIGDSVHDTREVEFDTSKLTFICLGALTDLRERKTAKKTSLGFGNSNESDNDGNYCITPQDLVDLGLERELVGRINTYLYTEEYSRDDLLKILKESSISPLVGFEKWVSSKRKKLQMDDGVYDAVVDAAYELNTGARSLQTIMNNIRTHFLKLVLRGNEEIVHLDLDTVVNINNSTFNRRGRR